MKMINFSNYSISINNKFILQNISFSIKKRGLYVLCGPSGSGKSSLLNAIVKADGFKNANIIGEKVIDLKPTDFHYIPVDDNIFALLTVNDNLKFFSSNQNEIDNILKELKIYNLKNKKCSLLSKGERERIAIASGLIDSKKVLLIDEPTSNLDIETSKLVYDIILKYSKEKIIIIATHDYKMIEDKADGLVYLENGKIIKNTICHHKDINTIKLKKSRFPFLTYSKFCISNLFMAKIGLIINAFVLSLSLLLLFMSLANFNLDYYSSYKNIVEKEIKCEFASFNDLNFDSMKMGYNEYLKNENLSSKDVVPTFNKRIKDININIVYSKYYSTKNVEERIKSFNSRYNFDNNQYTYYPIYINENIIGEFNDNKINLELGQECDFKNDDGCKLIFDGVLSKDIPFDAIVDGKYHFDRYNKQIDVLDFNENLDFYSIRDYINDLGDEQLKRTAFSMALGNKIRPYSKDIVIENGDMISSDDEIVINNSNFFTLLYSDDEKIADFNKNYHEKILINDPSYYLKGILEEFKVVGLAKKNINDNNEYIYVSENVFHKIKERIINNDYNHTYTLKYNKSFIYDNIDKLINGRYTCQEDIISYITFYNNIHASAETFFVISIFCSVLSLTISIVFLHNINKKNYKNYSLLLLLGKSKKNVYFVYLLQMLLVIILPLFISLLFSYPFTVSITNIFCVNNFWGESCKGSLVFGVLNGYLGIFVQSIILILLLFPTVLMIRKKKAIEYLNYE